MKYKEHYPSFTNLFCPSDLSQGQRALCGQRNAIVLNLWRSNDLDEEIICTKCRKLACVDCFGTGIIDGRQAGIICSCDYGTLRELSNNSHLSV